MLRVERELGWGWGWYDVWCHVASEESRAEGAQELHQTRNGCVQTCRGDKVTVSTTKGEGSNKFLTLFSISIKP